MATKPIWKAPDFGLLAKRGFIGRFFGGRIDYAHLGRNGVVVLGAEEFAEFEECMRVPKKPTQSVLEGAEQLRQLYKKSR